MKRKEAIKRTREGVVQIFNDYHPSIKEIKKFLKEAFPEDKMEENNTYILNEFFRKDSVCYELWFSSNNNFNLPVINISTITKRKKTKLKQLERKFSDLAKDVSELRQSLAKDVEVDVEEVKSELTQQAIDKGYKKGVKIKELFKYNTGTNKKGFEKTEVSDEDYIFDKENNLLFIGNLMIFNNGIWAEIIQQETIKEEEIDFSVQELFIYERGTYIVCSNGKSNLEENTFEGKVIYSTGVHKDINIFSKNWSKDCFKSFKGELTIK